MVAQLTEPGQVDHTLGRGGIDLEVAGKHHSAHRGFHCQGAGIGDGMVHMDEFHGKAAGLHGFAGLVGDELYLVRQAVLLQLQPDQTVGHGSAVDGAVHIPHQIGNGTDVVLVAMGDEDTLQLLLVGCQVGKVGDHQIHTIHILFREAHTAVNGDHVLAVFQHGNILADLIQTAKGNNFQFFSQFGIKLLSKKRICA